VSVQGKAWSRRGRLASVLVACFIGAFASLGASSPKAVPGAVRATGHDAVHAPLSCTNPQRRATVIGTPRLKAVPSLSAVTLYPHDGGLGVSISFRRPLVVAPEGVLISWRVFLYRHRHDAANPAAGQTLNLEDRGAGWEPSGWTITTALGGAAAQVDGNVTINKAGNELSVFFPKGFGDMSTPFYWYANEWEFRSFLPTKNPDKPNYAVTGSVSFDCPTGVTASGVPDPKLLLHATS